jgi:NAD kinase
MLPHTLTSRPLIVTDNSKITITAHRPVVMFADGRYINEFDGGETITVHKKNHNLKLIRPYDWNFYDNLKDKMSWST